LRNDRRIHNYLVIFRRDGRSQTFKDRRDRIRYIDNIKRFTFKNDGIQVVELIRAIVIRVKRIELIRDRRRRSEVEKISFTFKRELEETRRGLLQISDRLEHRNDLFNTIKIGS